MDKLTRIRKENIKYGKKIKKRLVDLGMSSKELAEKLEVDPRYVSKILRGERSGLKYRKKIREILKMEDAA